MATYLIPNNAGPYQVIQSMAGTPLVTNDRTGRNKVRIACKSSKQAKEICRRLNEDDLNGQINA